MRSFLATMLLLGLAQGCAPPVSGDDAIASAVRSQPTESVRARIAAVPGVMSVSDHVSVIVTAAVGCHEFVVQFRQPVDHARPDSATFAQRLLLQYCDESAPVVFSPDGYGYEADFFRPELVGRLHANWLWAEHRFYGTSMPAADPEQRTLTVRQSADDDHAIVTAFRGLFPRRWISTGASNGGMNAVFHARFYPDDVDGVVAYVAPFMQGAPDLRFPPFIDAQGDLVCRASIVAYQRAIMTRQAELVAAMPPGFANPLKSLRSAARAYRWAFWQYDGDCHSVLTPEASATDIIEDLYLRDDLQTDAECAVFAPYWKQAKAELGLGGNALSGIEDLVTDEERRDDDTSDRYDPTTMNGVVDWLANSASRLVFIYGDHDPYSAAPANPDSSRDNLVVYAHGHGHEANLTMLDSDDRAEVLRRVARWADATVSEPRALEIELELAGRRAITTRLHR